MADIIDVQNALATLLMTAIYPNGTGQASAANGVPCLIYPGWPDSATLNADLLAGKAHVTIYAKAEERNVTRYSDAQQVVVPASPTLTATVSGANITIGGTVSVPQNVALLVNGKSYVYAVRAGDTLASIATALAALVAADVANTAAIRAVITLGGSAYNVIARVGAAATVSSELKRQERVFTVTVWANTPQNRDLIAALADVAMASARFLTLADGYAARLIYRNSIQSDSNQKETLYRRDLNYSVEYATTKEEQAMQVTGTITNIGSGGTTTLTLNK